MLVYTRKRWIAYYQPYKGEGAVKKIIGIAGLCADFCRKVVIFILVILVVGATIFAAFTAGESWGHKHGDREKAAIQQPAISLTPAPLPEAKPSAALKKVSASSAKWEVLTIHTVRRNESVIGIAKKYNILPWQLREMNGMKPGAIIRPKQKLSIPKVDWNGKGYCGPLSWYGNEDDGKPMANGGIFDETKISFAHRTAPFGLWMRATNLKTGVTVEGPILDRGPYAKDKNGNFLREWDGSKAVAIKLGYYRQGTARICTEFFYPNKGKQTAGLHRPAVFFIQTMHQNNPLFLIAENRPLSWK